MQNNYRSWNTLGELAGVIWQEYILPLGIIYAMSYGAYGLWGIRGVDWILFIAGFVFLISYLFGQAMRNVPTTTQASDTK
jgi:hypothetical protein